MEILGLEKVSLVDFEGYVCATIFTGGCNFACPFCHNNSLVKRQVKPLKTQQVLDYLKERKNLLDAVTISGGEPTLQPDLAEFIKEVRKLGLKVKLDTNGSNPAKLEELLSENLLDYVAMDIKNNFDDYGKITGLPSAPIEKIKKSLQLLRDSGIDYELRTTLVKGYHTLKNIEKMGQELKGEKKLYLQKFVDSGDLIGENIGLEPIDIALAHKFCDILGEGIVSVQLRGY